MEHYEPGADLNGIPELKHFLARRLETGIRSPERNRGKKNVKEWGKLFQFPPLPALCLMRFGLQKIYQEICSYSKWLSAYIKIAVILLRIKKYLLFSGKKPTITI